MGVLLAVIDDLFQFASASVQRLLVTQEWSSYAPFSYGGSHTMDAGPEAMLPDASPRGMPYFVGEQDVPLYLDPVISFDSVVLILSYGDLIRVKKLGGRWANVEANGESGWILKDILRESVKDVLPFLVSGELYDAKDPQTKKLRLCIHDMFNGGLSSCLLSDVEYVTFRLLKKGKRIAWDSQRPRIAGTWQKLLKGRSNIHMGIAPKTESVIEYLTDDVGHVGFVDAVFPDLSIKISSVGISQEGMFEEMLMSKEEWKELRPVFIEVL